jgi:hypothetical protein
VGITFTLYKDQSLGAPLWLETQNVQADGSVRYTVLLGSSKPDGLPMDLFASGEARWLGVQVTGEAEQPRTLLVSTPYALKAADTGTLSRLPSVGLRAGRVSEFKRTTTTPAAPDPTASSTPPPASTVRCRCRFHLGM